METIRKLVGQLFLVGFDGHTVPSDFASAIAEYHIGGTIYFKRNVKSPEQLAALSNQIQFDCRKGDVPPLIISIDHEGGIVNRLSAPFTKFPGIDHLGEINSPKVAFTFGMVLAKELAAVGINLDFAPVVDVLTNPNNPIIKGRSFSSDPEIVAKLGSAHTRGLQKMGVAAVAKHFPGHGDTEEDSHLTLPTVTKSLEEMEKCELIPFRRLIRSRVEGIMTAHIINKGLDPEWPATLSPKIINDLLRTQMRYSKVIFSDDMEMKAIADNYGAEEAAVMAIQAGCDMLIYRGDPGFPVHAYEAIIKAIENKKLSKERIEVSAQRIANMKKAYCLQTKPIDPATLSQFIGLPEHQELSEAIAKKHVPKELLEDSDE